MSATAPRGWLPRWQRRHEAAIAGGAWGIASASIAIPEPSLETQLGVLAIGVAAIGLPHGAVDPWTHGRQAVSAGVSGFAGFAIRYLALAGLVVAAWAAAPPLALCGFLAVSIWHFGLCADSGATHSTATTILVGALPVLAPLFFRPDETLSSFATLAGPAFLPDTSLASSAQLLAAVWALGAAARAVGLARSALHGEPGAAVQCLGWTGTIALFAALPVLLAFGLYFCLDHSIRHTLQTAAGFDAASPRRALTTFAARALPLTVLTLVLAAIAWGTWLRSWSSEALMMLVFVGLASLTLPHVVLHSRTGLEEAPNDGAHPRDDSTCEPRPGATERVRALRGLSGRALQRGSLLSRRAAPDRAQSSAPQE